MTLDASAAAVVQKHMNLRSEQKKWLDRGSRERRVSQKLEHMYRAAGWPRLFYLDESRDHRMNASVLPRQTINIKERPLFCQFALSCCGRCAHTHTHSNTVRGEENLFYRLWNHANRSFKSLPSRIYSLTPRARMLLFLSPFWKHRLFYYFHSPQLLFFSHNSSPVCRRLTSCSIPFVFLCFIKFEVFARGVRGRHAPPSQHTHWRACDYKFRSRLATERAQPRNSSGPFVSSSRHPGPVFLCFIKFFAPQSHTFFLPSDITRSRKCYARAGKLIVSGDA